MHLMSMGRQTRDGPTPSALQQVRARKRSAFAASGFTCPCRAKVAEVCAVKAVVRGAVVHRCTSISVGWMRAAVVTVLVALAFPVAAAHVEVQGGRSYMDGFASNALFVEGVFAEHRIGNSRFSWSPDVALGWIDGRDLARFRDSRYSTQDAVWLLAGGARFHYGSANDWYRPLFFGAQLALQTGRTLALSSGYEFVSTLGWQGQRFSFQLRHISNAGLHDPNRGETMALVGVGFDL